MSAFVILEATVKDEASYASYVSQAVETLKESGGEVQSAGPWHVLFGEPVFQSGAIIRFPDRATALAWYESPNYQRLLDLRAKAFDCRFRLIG